METHIINYMHFMHNFTHLDYLMYMALNPCTLTALHNRMEMLFTYSKKYEIFLIVFTNAIVDPRTMVIHFSYTTTTDTTISQNKYKINTGICRYYFCLPHEIHIQSSYTIKIQQ